MSKQYDQFIRLLTSSMSNLSQSFYDDYVEKNTTLRARAGVKCFVIRRQVGKCCKWCASLAGIYEKGKEPADVYRRHRNCKCLVTFKTERGTYSDAWSKREFGSQRAARIARAEEIEKMLAAKKVKDPKALEEKIIKKTAFKGLIEMNLQFFANNAKTSINNKIKNGEINEAEFKECSNYYKSKFEHGVYSPIGKVYDNGNAFYHIVDRHDYMMSKENVDRIIDTLERPEAVFISKDKAGTRAYAYVEDANKNPMLVIVRDKIITAYVPRKAYLNKIKKGEYKWRKH